MFERLAINRGVLALAILLLVLAPGVAHAERRIQEEGDHSNQDWGEPDTNKAPRWGDPGRWGGPKDGPGFDGAWGDLGLPSVDGAESWIADVLTGAPRPLSPSPALVIPANDGPLGAARVRSNLGLDGFGPRPLLGENGGGTFAPPPPVPEPATPVLLVLGAVLLAARRRK